MNIPQSLQIIISKFQSSENDWDLSDFKKLMLRSSDNRHTSFGDTYYYLLENCNAMQLNEFINQVERLLKKYENDIH